MSVKTATSVVNEAAKSFDLAPNYTVTEQGQGHSKQFKVDLYLGECGPYEGKGPNIKAAKNAAASTALQECSILSKASTNNNPVEELNILAMKHGVFLEFKEQRLVVQRPGMKNYENLLLPGYQTQYQSRAKQNWKISVNIIGRTFLGQGRTKKEAKVQAAQNALKALKEEIAKGRISESCKSPSGHDLASNGFIAKGDMDPEEKPEIAVLYEIVAKLHVPITFTVLEEEGLNHNRKYKISCKVGEMEAIGIAVGKKKAKKEAASKMLNLIRETEIANALARVTAKIGNQDSVEENDIPDQNLPGLNWVNKNYRRPKEKKSETELNDDMDPISYLVHLMQVRKESPPVFTLVEEQKQHTNRVFKMKASVGEHEAFGVANRKRDAKAVAAENLLKTLGIRSGEISKDDFEQIDTQEKAEVVNQPMNSSLSMMSFYRGGGHVHTNHHQPQQQQQIVHENSYHWVNSGPVPSQLVDHASLGPEIFASQVSYQPTQVNDRGMLHRGMVI